MQKPSYGPPRVIVQLNITLVGGSQVSVVSDTDWKGRQGPVVLDSVYNGEKFDATLERYGWSKTGFQDNTSLWLNAEGARCCGCCGCFGY